jgi:Ni,Fe-hydrogenase I cytochrome b subunit
LLSFFVLIATGLAIHAGSNAIGTIGFVRQTHFVAMFVFVLTTVTRIYWAFFGAGSAPTGGLVRHPDWRRLTGVDWKFIPALGYYLFLRKAHPPVVIQPAAVHVRRDLPARHPDDGAHRFAMFEPTASMLCYGIPAD